MVKLDCGNAARDYFRTHDRVSKFVDNHVSTVHSIAWNADGKRLASGSLDKTVGVASFDPSKGLRTEFTCKGHSDQVDQVAWHQTAPEILASASGDKTLRIWDVRTKRGIHTVHTKGQNLNVAWSPDGNHIAVGDKDDKICVVDARNWKIKHEEQFKTETNEFAWDPTGQYFFVASGQGQLYVFNFPDMKEELVIQAHPCQALCISIKMDPLGRYFAVGGGDALITIWDLPNLTCMRTIDRLDWPVRAVSFSWDGVLLAGGSEDHCIDISYTDTAERVFDLKTDGETYSWLQTSLTYIAWHPREYMLAYSCDDSSGRGGDRRADNCSNIKLFGMSSTSR